MKDFACQGVALKLGQRDFENDKLIDEARPEHMWVHLNSFPSGHVIIESDDVDDKVLQFAGQLCLQHSKVKHLRSVKAIATPISNLKKTGTLGEVQFVSKRQTRIFEIVKAETTFPGDFT